jgi:hypothetical protein
VGDGDDPAGWTPLYWYDPETMSYQGSNMQYDGSLQINPGGTPFMQRNSVNLAMSGTYHVVLGLLYQNEIPSDHSYRIIAYRGFDYYNLARELKYYDLTESTGTISVGAMTTMSVNIGKYKGDIVFPLPSELQGDWQFPNLDSTDWQETASYVSLWYKYLPTGSDSIDSIKITKVKYHYITAKDVYEIEPFAYWEEWDGTNNRLICHTTSLGTYTCSSTGTQWEQIKAGYSNDTYVQY